jgi:hypothetical protein
MHVLPFVRETLLGSSQDLRTLLTYTINILRGAYVEKAVLPGRSKPTNEAKKCGISRKANCGRVHDNKESYVVLTAGLNASSARSPGPNRRESRLATIKCPGKAERRCH